MKTNKVTKLGVSLLSVAALGVVAPALIDTPIFGSAVVKAEETKPLEYRIVYYDKDTGEEIAPPKIGTINPGEIVNIYKDIDGYQVVSNFDEWMPGFNASYRIMSKYFGFSRGRLFMSLDYKKVNADAKPSEEVKPETKPSETPKSEVKPETKPSETPKPEVKPEPKPSETPKPEVKPEPAPKDEEKQESLKYRIRHLLEGSNKEIAPMETGVLNPGESINIRKNLEGYQAVSNYSWMPDYNLTHDIVSTYFYGAADGYREGYIEYRKLDADAKPSDTPKPEVKPETKPSETPKPEVKPEPKPSETPKPEVKPETKPSETPKPEVKPETKPSDTPKPEVKPAPKPSDTSKPEVKPAPKPSDTSKPEVKPAPKPSETPKPEVKPEPKPSDTSKPEVKPVPKPSETPKPEVKPELKPSDTSKPEVKPAPKPSETPKPEVKSEPKPSETPKPEVKPEPKPSDTSKSEVKPELKPQTNSNTAPKAPVKPVGQTSNSKADKPTSKKETPALPNTGEQSSSLSLVGLLLASLGLAGLTYKGRH
ncbi:LPXTG cell wall anchor domain-containing protein [Streptococcus infantis]|uniref:LPXTG cell wall anchor domain-containing protein n=1 Tax=Streptococcus infantis TaxID=68892 RepID=UPI0039C295FA